MGGIFSPKIPKPPPPPPPPKPVRLPSDQDPNVEAAARRRRGEALRRKGRGSTILTESLGQRVGSSGQKLGS